MALLAVNWQAEFSGGDNRPQLFQCDNDGSRERWVLKLLGKAHVELAADWIGSVLAHQIGVPCPDVEVADVPADAIHSTEELLDLASPDTLGRLWAIDSWLDVLDRYRSDGFWNALVDKMQEPARRFTVIDFGKGLMGCLLPLLGAPLPFQMAPYPRDVQLAVDRSSLRRTSELIGEMLAAGEVEAVVASTPPAWLAERDRAKVIAFLRDRAGRLLAYGADEA